VKPLPYTQHDISEGDIDAVVTVLRGSWLTTGPAIETFEAALAETTGAQYAIACSSGTETRLAIESALFKIKRQLSVKEFQQGPYNQAWKELVGEPT
jgi:dTDP-4-amino-4,6-dideoxygalactose transaminase